jgi:hypothetical protein
MNEQMRRCAVGFLVLGLTSIGGLAAAAQDIDDDGYVVEERTIIREQGPVVADIDDDDDDNAVLVVQRDGMQRCSETFRSFDPTTGTYVTYGGETRVCPYIE